MHFKFLSEYFWERERNDCALDWQKKKETCQLQHLADEILFWMNKIATTYRFYKYN